MPVQFAPKSESFGGKLGTALGSGVGQGLSNLIETKISDLQKKKKVEDRKKTYEQADLPEWLAELPEELQETLLKQWASASPEEKDETKKALENIGIEGMDEEPQQQQMQQPQPQQQMQQPQQTAQPPTQQDQMQLSESTIPGMNNLMQAGAGQREANQGNPSPGQAFPQEGHGLSGKMSPQQNPQPQPQESKPRQRTFGELTGKKSSGKPITEYQKAQLASSKDKLEKGEQKKIESKKHVQKAYDRTQEILDSGYTGYSITGLGPEGRKQRNELDTLSEVFISNLIPLLNPKGTMSKERFNYIKGLAPNSWDTDATIKGKLAALKDIFDLNGSSPEKSSKGTVEMRDASGQIYDIPEDQVEKAKKGGLK